MHPSSSLKTVSTAVLGSLTLAITAFVAATTTATDARYLPRAERIAVFDNDGTLWAEQPMYVQLV